MVLFQPDGSGLLIGVMVRFTLYQGDIMDFSATDVRQYVGELESVIAGWEAD